MMLKLFAATGVLVLAPAALYAQAPAAPPAPVAPTNVQATPAPGRVAAPASPATAGPPIAERPVQSHGDLLATLRADGRFTTLVKGLEATNLADLIRKQPNLTLFAPTDRAFQALPATELQQLMNDKPTLQKLLVRHLINARVDTSKIKGAKGPVPSVAGDSLLLDGSGETLQVDAATILQADVLASNGVLHVVDSVLRHGAATASTPAPAAGG